MPTADDDLMRLACPSCKSVNLATVEIGKIDYSADFIRRSDGGVQVEYTGAFTIVDEATRPTGLVVCRNCGSECDQAELVPAQR